MKKLIPITVMVLLTLGLLAGPATAQGSNVGEKPAVSAAQLKKITIIGKIAKDEERFIIQGTKPPEIFTIHNPNPQVLEKFIQSGQTVTIEARIIMGDNIYIDKIDGKPFGETKGK